MKGSSVKRRGCSVLSAVLCLTVLWGCTNADPAEDGTLLSDLLTTDYPLSELQDYFGTVLPNENLQYGTGQDSDRYNYEKVDERFPIECTRRLGSVDSYSVYRVREGGYYYVFWSLPVEGDDAEDAVGRQRGASVYFAVRLSPSALRSASDFDSLRPGIDTAEDVARIDPAFELIFLMNRGICSFSLLKDGTVLEICYRQNGVIESRRDLTVDSMTVRQREDIPGACCLVGILPQDLP